MSKYDSNNIMECFKMSVDLKKVKEIEIYIKNLEEENNRLKEQKKKFRSWLEGLIGECKLEDIIQLSIFHFVLSKLNELENKNDENGKNVQ